jgi:LacI family repressor for deo operon, udp, cdd, tsx, nupC, and nupG
MPNAVERLGYTPNAAATNLRTLRTKKFVVTVPDISNPFFSLSLQGIEETAQQEGYWCCSATSRSSLARSRPSGCSVARRRRH